MPPRLLSCLIIAFWLGMTAWIIHRDIWPRLAPGEPPLFTISPADESRRGSRLPERWSVVRTPSSGQSETYLLLMTSRYDSDDDLYHYRVRLEPPYGGQNGSRLFRLARMTSVYRVRPNGTLNDFEIDVDLPAGALGVVPRQQAHFHGVNSGLVCNLHWDRGTEERKSSGIEPVAISQRGVVFLPLHPLRWIHDIKPGQGWGVPAFDPLTYSGILASNPSLTWVNARVRPERVVREWKRQSVECLVIDYEGETIRASVWVDAEDHRVLFQEARLGDERWEIRRE